MKQPKIRVFVPESPLHVEAAGVEIHYVGLGQPPESPEHRVFILLQVPGLLDAGAMIHLSLDDAGFLREAIEAVLERHRVIVSSCN